jgi:hypothetical protein
MIYLIYAHEFELDQRYISKTFDWRLIPWSLIFDPAKSSLIWLVRVFRCISILFCVINCCILTLSSLPWLFFTLEESNSQKDILMRFESHQILFTCLTLDNTITLSGRSGHNLLDIFSFNNSRYADKTRLLC